LAAIVDEAIDKGTLDATALVKAVHGTKETEKEAEAKKETILTDAKKLLLLKERW
jgi:hypothetical protein